MNIFVRQQFVSTSAKQFHRIVSLKKLENINQQFEDKQACIRETYLFQQEANRARRIIGRSHIELGDYIGSGDKSFSVGGKKIEATEDSFVILRNKGFKNEFPEYYTTDELYQPFVTKQVRDAENFLPAMLKHYMATTEYFHEKLLENKKVLLKKWLDKNKIPGKNINEQIKRIYEYDDEKFENLLK